MSEGGDYICRHTKSVGGADIVSLGVNCGVQDGKEKVWIAYEGSLPGYSGSIPTGWCVLENGKYKQQFKLVETAANPNSLNKLSITSENGHPERPRRHFKAIEHGNGQVKILNAEKDKLLKMHFGAYNFLRADCSKDSTDNKCLFTFGEAEDGPGEVVLNTGSLNYSIKIIIIV